MRTPLTAVALSVTLSTSVFAQEETRSGYAMDWNKTLQERADPLVVNRRSLNGWSFVVYECGTSQAMSHWKAYMETLGGVAKSSRPVRVSGATIPGLVEAIPIVFADAHKDHEAGGVRVHLAFARNDTTSAPEDPGLVNAVHEMAVKVNRAVVTGQVAEQEKRLKKIGDELEEARKEETKASDRTASAGKDLEKVNVRQAKLARKLADIQKETNKLRERYAKEADPKTLEKIARKQQEEADVKKDIAKQQEAESKAQEHKNEHEQEIPEAKEHQRKHEGEKELAIRELEALKRKLEAIR